MVYATGSLRGVVEVLTIDAGARHEPLAFAEFMTREFENFRGYFTMTELVAAFAVAFALLLPGSKVAAAFLHDGDGQLRRLLAVTIGIGVAYQLSSPNRARLHHYWQFCFVPFAVLAFVVMIRGVLQKSNRVRNALLVVIAIEVVTSSAYKLYRRHTRPDAWAIEATRSVETQFLTPK